MVKDRWKVIPLTSRQDHPPGTLMIPRAQTYREVSIRNSKRMASYEALRAECKRLGQPLLVSHPSDARRVIE